MIDHQRCCLIAKIECAADRRLAEQLRLKPIEWLESLYRLVAAGQVSPADTGIEVTNNSSLSLEWGYDFVRCFS